MIQPAPTDTLAVAVRGDHITLSINGTTLPAIADATLTTCDFIALSFNNLANTAGSVVASDFSYQPLP